MSNDSLFLPIAVGAHRLSHRVVLAPLTRMRAVLPGSVPGHLMAEYYRQRASPGGLLIAEGANVTEKSGAYLGTPGIYSNAQIEGWRRITDAVHAEGSVIYLQLWHPGRTSHVSLSNGETPIAPSAIAYDGTVFTEDGWRPVSPSRALATDEVALVVELFGRSAMNALAAGFDGVEIHAAHGYLPDQFLQDASNKRTDRYGGSIANRARFLLEVTSAVARVFGAERVGIRLSPDGNYNGMGDSNPEALFSYVADKLNSFGLAYLHLVEPRVVDFEPVKEGSTSTAVLRKIFKRSVILAGGFERDSAERAVATGRADLVAFGRHFIANPDLPLRFQLSLPLNPYDRSTFYGGNERGYVDYPRHDACNSGEPQ